MHAPKVAWKCCRACCPKDVATASLECFPEVPMPALPEKTEAPEPGDFQLVHFPVAEAGAFG